MGVEDDGEIGNQQGAADASQSPAHNRAGKWSDGAIDDVRHQDMRTDARLLTVLFQDMNVRAVVTQRVLAEKTLRQNSSVMSCGEKRAGLMPALFTSASTRPKRSYTASTNAPPEASPSTIARPMPVVEPVTMTTCR